MEKIKSLLTGHHKEEHDAAHETGHAPSSTTASTTTASTTHHTGSSAREESPRGSALDSSSDPRLAGSASGLTRDQRMAGEGQTAGHSAGTGASSDTTHPLRGAAGTDYSSGGAAAAGTTGRGLTGETLPDRTAGTDRSFPLSGGATTGQHTGTGAGLTGSTTSGPHSSDLANRVDPRGATETTGTTGTAGTTTGGLGSGHEGHGRDRVKEIVSMVYEHEHHGIGHQYKGDPCATDQPHEHAPGGPHQTVTANVLDPHVGGGELPPLSSGNEPVPYASGTSGTGMSGTGTSSTGTTGTGMTGTGMTGTGMTGTGMTGTTSTGMTGTTAGQTGTGMSATGTTGGTTGGHHYGRDAGLASAGAAVAGGLAEHERGHRAGPTAEDPASRTVGPHSSNVMNVLDPRVQPQPEKMRDHTTTGPHQSDIMNRMDPRMDSGSTQTGAGRDHHYGRDAALAGGVGAAGVGAYEAGQHRGTEGIGQTTQGYGSQRAPPTAGAYESEHRHRDPVTTGYDNLLSGREDPRTGLRHGDDSHRGRDAAAIGGAGAVGAGAGHGFTREDAERAQRHRMGVLEGEEKPQEKPQEKGGLLGFGHREKTSRDPSPRREEKHHEHGGLLGFGHKEKTSRDPSPRATEKDEKHQGGLLGLGHKEKTSRDPSPRGTTTAMGTDPTADRYRGTEAAVGTGAGLAGAGAAAEGMHHHNKLHKDPPPGYYNDQNTTGAGPISGMGAGATSGDPRLTGQSTQGGTNEEGVVIEPHTGLPMNVAKYGTDGRGGIENEQAPGLQHTHMTEEERANWEAIRKANTPY